MKSFLAGAEQYIDEHKRNGRYYIENPSLAVENGKRVFAAIGTATATGVATGATKVNASTGTLSKVGTIAVAANHHYHGEVSKN